MTELRGSNTPGSLRSRESSQYCGPIPEKSNRVNDPMNHRDIIPVDLPATNSSTTGPTIVPANPSSMTNTDSHR